MQQIVQSYLDGELVLAETAVPQHVSRGALLVRTVCSLVSAGAGPAMSDVARRVANSPASYILSI